MGELHASWTAEIEAPIADVYAIAADVPNSPDWQPSLAAGDDASRPTTRAGRRSSTREADAKVRTTKQRLRFSYDEPTGMSWVQEKGDVKSLPAAGRSPSSAPDRTARSTSCAPTPGRMLGMLLRGPVEGKVKEFLTKGAAEGLKRAAESG